MEKSSYPSDQADKFMLRLPDGMRDRIADAASVAGRSMNAEIITRLHASFEARKADPSEVHEIELQLLELEVKFTGLMSRYRALVVDNEMQHMRERQLLYKKAPPKEIAAAVKQRVAGEKQLIALAAQIQSFPADQMAVLQERLRAAKR